MTRLRELVGSGYLFVGLFLEEFGFAESSRPP